jgi:nucleoside-diphosphate-sugar epimerase
MNNLQTIFGAGGAIGIPLTKELKNYTNEIRLVSRNPKKVNDTDILYPIPNLSREEIFKSIQGSKIVYVTIGLEYKLKIWQNEWPKLMRNIIDACKENNAKLVFFDNVYMYAKNEIPFMTEDAKMNPPSEKGKVRKSLVDMILAEVEKKQLTAMIARCADFYGPEHKNSMLSEMVIKQIANKKKPQMFGDINKIHTFTFTPDAGKATALLGNTEDAYNQIWHLPTTKEKWTSKMWLDRIAKEMNADNKIQYLPKWMMKILGLFIPILREFPEMMYQYEQDYIFDSSKFEKRFGIMPTPPEVGIKEMVKNVTIISK